MFREPLVDEAVIGGEQIEHVPIFAHDAVEEELRFALHRLGQAIVVLRVEQHVGMNLVEILQPQPLAREALRQRIRSRIREHPLHLLLDAEW